MQSVLVTGGAGFIGSHLCDLLIEKGYKVICLDNLLTGSKDNIKQLLDNPNFKFIDADVTKTLNLDISDLDFIFHLASPASPIDYQNYPEETLLANSMGTINVLKLTEEQGAKVLIASTSEIYGDPLEHPQKETYWGNTNSFGPRSCYDESKRFAEAATYVYLKKHAVDARIIRIFNTYGPRMQKDDGRVVSNFINQCLEGSPITIYGDGSQTRSFCYISDMIAGICKAMFSEETNAQVFNLGNPIEFTMMELAENVKKLTGAKSEIIYKPLPPDDPKQRQPDITKANKFLGWEPKVSLDEGLQKTIEYYQSI
jgi:nucleoside-diphosphate-sugar epimerase